MKKRVLSVFSLTMMNVIAIDSLRNLAINAEYGAAIITFFVLGTVLFLLPCILVTAEMATNHPKLGGSYAWISEAFGPKMGFFNTWLQWIYNVIWYPTILSFIAVNIAYLIDPSLATHKAFIIPMVIGLFFVATLANMFGMKVSSGVTSVGAILGTIVPMVLIIVLAVVWQMTGHVSSIQFTEKTLFPSLHHWHNLSFFVIILFSLIGIELSSVHAEEVANPQRDYPRSLWYSSAIIVTSMILASLAIAMSLPAQSISLIGGLNQTFLLFLKDFHLQALMPWIILAIIFGGFSGMSAWVIGPTKALMAAAQRGVAPELLGRQNKHGAPVVVLWLQFVVVVILCLLFDVFPSMDTAYSILSVLTAQLALVYYIILFAAVIRLRRRAAVQPGAYRIPGGKPVLWLVCGVGILTCLLAIVLGFVPPNDLKIGNTWLYEAILVGGMLLCSLLPFVLIKKQS